MIVITQPFLDFQDWNFRIGRVQLSKDVKKKPVTGAYVGQL